MIVVRTIIVSLFTGICALSAQTAPWTPTTSLPDVYDAHALVAGPERLYHIGGFNSLQGVLGAHRVLSATLQATGGVGAWSDTSAMPDGKVYHAAVAANGYVFALGGMHYFNFMLDPTNTVYYAQIQPGGALGAWAATTPLPQHLYFLGAAAWNGTIYVVGGTDGQVLFNTVYAADINANGSLSSWRTEATLPADVYDHASVADGTLYAVGGMVNGGSQSHNAVWSAQINANNTLQPWTVTTSLPQPVSNLRLLAGAGRIFTIGGWAGTASMGQVLSAPSNVSGLGTWSAETSLPLPLNSHAATVADGRIYVSAGLSDFNAQDPVYWMPLPPPPLAFSDLGSGLAGVSGVPALSGSGTLAAGSSGSLSLTAANASSPALLCVALASVPAPFKGGVLVAFPFTLVVALATDGSGALLLPFVWPSGVPAGTSLYFQYAIQDAAGPQGASLSNALKGVTP